MARIRPTVARECEICRRSFMALLDSVKRGKGKTCSVACRVKKAARCAPRPPRAFAGIPLVNGKMHPMANRARSAVHKAIERGELVRPATCARCGGSGDIHAHHEDYRQPLVVAWLCKSCHQRRHVEIHRAGASVGGIA